jgi:hypothetical protein
MIAIGGAAFKRLGERPQRPCWRIKRAMRLRP